MLWLSLCTEWRAVRLCASSLSIVYRGDWKEEVSALCTCLERVLLELCVSIYSVTVFKRAPNTCSLCVCVQWPELCAGPPSGHSQHILLSVWRSQISCLLCPRYMYTIHIQKWQKCSVHVTWLLTFKHVHSNLVSLIAHFLVYLYRQCECRQPGAVPSLHPLWDTGQPKETIPSPPLTQRSHLLSLRYTRGSGHTQTTGCKNLVRIPIKYMLM